MDPGTEHTVTRSGVSREGERRGTRVGDIMERNVVQISAEDRLSTVDDIMTLGGVRHMPVVSGGRLVGVVSERDLLRASLSSFSDFAPEHHRAFLQALEIRRVMSAPPITVSPDEPVGRAARLMARLEFRLEESGPLKQFLFRLFEQLKFDAMVLFWLTLAN